MELKGNKIKKYEWSIILVILALVIVLSIAISRIIFTGSEMILKDEISELVTSNNKQIQFNIDTYLEKLETNGTLLFSDSKYYKYDATKKKDEYKKIQIEDEIKDRIVDLGLVENYSDFGIVYKDNSTIGWVSNGTIKYFGMDSLYSVAKQNITDAKSKDGWLCGIANYYDRVYYLKEINDNAILITSFYTSEFNSLFSYEDNFKKMKVRVVDENDVIIYSTNKKEVGKEWKKEIITTKSSNYVSGDLANNIITSTKCKNGWRTVCSVPKKDLYKKLYTIRKNVYIIITVFAVILGVISCFFIRKISTSIAEMLHSLSNQANYDGLSTLVNKSSFKEFVKIEMDNIHSEKYWIFIMLDMDNFKQINDNLGHDYGDKVIKRMGLLLKDIQNDNEIIGRLGGDEFAIFMKSDAKDKENLDIEIENYMTKMKDAFQKEYADEGAKFNVSLSSGVYIRRPGNCKFDSLYKRADEALYKAKKSGKNCYIVDKEI